MKFRLLFAAVLASLVPHRALAGTLTEGFINYALPPAGTLEAAAASGGIAVPIWVIIFYIFYLGVIWSFNIAMYSAEGRLPAGHSIYAKYLCRANIFLASGDTAMFIAFLVAFLFPEAFQTADGTQRLMQLLLLGVFSTSLTMSVYYFYIAKYYQSKFQHGAWTLPILIVLVFFVIRLLLHYNPANIWFSMMLPPGEPNYTAWLRNIPLFIYGLLSVGLVLYTSKKKWREDGRSDTDRFMVIAMVALIVSFILYGIDIFYSHMIPREWIYYIYALKTLAYMAAFFFMWMAEFSFPLRRPTEDLRRGE
jgi:hypothetical protein